MRYASIRSMDISNGEGVGVALFVQGCHFHCKDCFNPETWDFAGGKEWTQEVEDKFIGLVAKPYVVRVSLLGGEPLADENVFEVMRLTNKIKELYPEKKIWCYTGYRYEQIFPVVDEILFGDQRYFYRKLTVENCDVLVDGRFDTNLKDLGLKFRGSSNQRIIDVPMTKIAGSIIECQY